MSVDPVEALWVVVLLAALVVTAYSLIDARDNQAAVKLMNGHAREVIAAGNVRREALRIVVQSLLLSIAIPGLFSDRPITLTPPLIALILVPIVLMVATMADARDRRRTTVITAAELVVQREDSIKRLEAMLAENTRISQEASDHAQEAYKEANTINEKIAAQGAQILAVAEAIEDQT